MKIDRVLALLSERIGLNPESLGPTAIPKLIAERMGRLGIENPNAYAEFLIGDPREFQTLVEGTVVVESWFFRGGDVFDFLAKRIAARSNGGPFRVLSVPCCTGEEPYSLAIALLEAGVPRTKWSILGVDLSSREIVSARRGNYPEFSFRQISAALKTRYFRAEKSRWQLDEKIAAAVDFRQENLVDSTFLEGEAPFDLIFCRNVTIYLTTLARVRTLNNLDRLLTPDGLLCMGHSEPLNDPRFEQFEPLEHFLYRRKSKWVAEVLESPAPPTAQPQLRISAPPKVGFSTPATAVKLPVATVDRCAEARRLADRGDTEAALEICRRLEASSAVNAELYHLMGVLHLARGAKDEAGNCFRKALYLNSNHAESLVLLIHHSRERGDSKQAELYRLRLERLSAGGGE